MTTTASKADVAEINEIKHLAYFYKSTQPNLATADFAKYIGFNIAGLQASKQAKLGSSAMHALLQHKTLPWAVCSCGRFETAGNEAQCKVEHGRHRSQVKVAT